MWVKLSSVMGIFSPIRPSLTHGHAVTQGSPQRRFLTPLRKDPQLTTALRQRMLQDLQLAGLSERTQETYLRSVRQLADHFHIPPDRLSEQQVRDYFLHLKNDRKFASASLGIAYSGIKFNDREHG